MKISFPRQAILDSSNHPTLQPVRAGENSDACQCPVTDSHAPANNRASAETLATAEQILSGNYVNPLRERETSDSLFRHTHHMHTHTYITSSSNIHIRRLGKIYNVPLNSLQYSELIL